MSAEETRLKVGAMVAVLEGQWDPRMWEAEILRDCAKRFKFFPSYNELEPVLDMWQRNFRVRDNPEIARRVMAHVQTMQVGYSDAPAALAIGIGKHLRVN